MLRERRPARSIVRAEDPLEVGIYANDDLARDVRIGEGSVREDERAPPRTLLFRRRRFVAGALGRFVSGLRIADHLVLLPGWRRTWVSAGYAKVCLPVI